jgi:DNA invertase Pin-like site-specific DNA recombinase
MIVSPQPSCHNRLKSLNSFSVSLLGGLAEFERDLIRTRTSEGRDRAKARGVKLGRKPKNDRTPEARGDPPSRP